MNKHHKFVKILAPLAVGVVLAFSNYAAGDIIKFNSVKPAVNGAALTDEQQGILAVRKAKASVVSIIGRPSSLGQPQAGINVTPQTDSGTGFIWSQNGLVITNNHVVAQQGLDYFVVFADGTEYPAKILGQDSYFDVAVLKIETANLPVADLGDSDGLETGQTVFAIGNALGKYQNTVTRGVVSGLGRSVQVDDGSGSPRLRNLIQTDASINPGNSGGPLINLNGQVEGMNTVIDRGGEGLGFAVPVNVIKFAVPQLVADGKILHPYLGVKFVTIDGTVKKLNSLPVSDGALVSEVVSGGPASKAGILPGDIIISINHSALSQARQLDDAVGQFLAGNQILVTLLRNKETVELPVILGQLK